MPDPKKELRDCIVKINLIDEQLDALTLARMQEVGKAMVLSMSMPGGELAKLVAQLKKERNNVPPPTAA